MINNKEFEGYWDELNVLLKEKERLLQLKDRSICPLCNSNIHRDSNDVLLKKINEGLEELETRRRRYRIKKNEEYWRKVNEDR